MNLQEQVCHNPQCWLSGCAEAGQIVIHSRKERRYRGNRWGTTFSATTQTPFSRIHTPHARVAIVVTLLAFGLDECTVAAWQRRARRQGERVHVHLVQAGTVTLGQVQADALRVRIAPDSCHADARAACDPVAALLVCPDGLIRYPRQALRAFRQPVHTASRGRPRLVLPPGVLIAHAAQRYGIGCQVATAGGGR